MTVLVAVVRLALAGLFVFSAVAKLRDRSGSREAVEAFGVPAVAVGAVATSLPFTELLCALLLVLPDPAATTGAVLSLLLLLAFTGAVVVNLLRGNRPECHCFGSVGDQGGIGWHTVARNGSLVVLAAVSLVGAGGLRSVPTELATLSLAGGLILLAFALLVAAVVVLATALRTLMQRYGSVLLRLDAVEQATGLAAPRPAADFTLRDLDGVRTTLADVLADGRPALIAFVSPTCHNCGDLLPDLHAWQSDPDHPLAVAVISDGSVPDNREKIADVGDLRLLLQNKLRVSNDYDILGTPGAVLVGADGLLAGAPVHGAGSIRDLHDATVRRMGADAPASSDPHLHEIEQRPVSAGDVAPPTALRSEEGEALTIDEAVGEQSVALFWRSDCGFCEQIVDDVRGLERLAGVRIVTESDTAEIRGQGLQSPILRDTDGSLSSWLRVPGTPSAARIREGVLDSSVAVGGPEVLALLRESASAAAAVESR